MSDLYTQTNELFQKIIHQLKNKSSRLLWNIHDANEDDIVFYTFSRENRSCVKALEDLRLKHQHLKEFLFTNHENDLAHFFFPLLKDVLDYVYPIDEKKKLIGITGTNGKTSTVHFLKLSFMNLKKNVLTVGTSGVYLNEALVEKNMFTSPPLIELRRIFHQYSSQYDLIVMEVSSHALDQKRVYGLEYDAIGFTSFSQDHLDYHHNMEDYFQSKMLLRLQSKRPFIISNKADQLKKLLPSYAYQTFELKNFPSEHLLFEFSYNRINFDVCCGILKALNFEINDSKNFEHIYGAKGRLESVNVGKHQYVVDFAHTPDALENVLMTLQSLAKRKSFDLVCVFGCGGDRDRTKRPLMMRAALKYCDFVYVTMDNPRSENPLRICDDMVQGISPEEEKKYTIIIDRENAIKESYLRSNASLILVAGKGEEDYILIGDEKKYHLDIECIRKLI